PQCFGLWIPPLSAEGLPAGWDAASFNVFKTWTEYINRLLGAVTGLLILATLILAVLDHRRSPRVLAATTAAFVLVLFNGWLGGVVVKSGLAPLILTGHLVFALLVVSCLLYATMQAFFPPGEIRARGSRSEMGVATLVVLAGVLLQVGVGAFLRGEVQDVAAVGVPREEWLAHVGWVETLHQLLAPFTVAAVVVVSGLAIREPDPWTRRVGQASAALVLVQGVAGLGLDVFAFPRILQVVHLWAASLLLGTLTAQALLAWRIDPRVARTAS
ncbi:MAG: COX15/CtaA family protein, partial [Myxococcota bacterium]